MLTVFDLDGTLICSKRRLYTLFCDLLGHAPLTYEEYWAAKFSNRKHADILKQDLGYTTEQYASFEQHWMGLIESDRYLEIDTLIPGAFEYLAGLEKHAQLYLCTARQSASQAAAQLKKLGIYDFFEKILVTGGAHGKQDLLARNIHKITLQDWFIGDTGADISVGKALGFSTCGVLSGFSSKEYLSSFKPDRLIENITFFEL